ncbi:hypothetical protein GON01_13960 [Sphingomonas sp. MAH-20]|uniref:Uncharacterized protein n=1 Tax=Sphingomonas horti TaxID=2682842 RepID=A0A6I4J3X5_9SPHN|nr:MULTISPECIES: hypothetical protein [Sphingomonas]MBA2919003.1 hypothetical protein [Sphingomonas sp. CGMCC 1.13658]MVO79036.1 hypothetical protein [Sphingomonas horti]
MGAWFRLAALLAPPLLLAGCLLMPGKFASKLTINADRSFSYAYAGEVYALDPQPRVADSSGKDAPPDPKQKAEQETRNRAIAEALSKEAGYRSVRYLGDGKFLIDYEISGRLDHNFVYPFNLDAQAIVPFIAVELRANGTVRVKAPGFANDSKDQAGPMSGMGDDSGAKLDGSFVLDTDAEVVSTNNEEGPQAAGGRKLLSWKVTPLTRDAPTAVLRLK